MNLLSTPLEVSQEMDRLRARAIALQETLEILGGQPGYGRERRSLRVQLDRVTKRTMQISQMGFSWA